MAPIEAGRATFTGTRAVIRLACGTTGPCIGNLEVYVVAKPTGSGHKRRLIVATGRFSMRAGQTMSVSVPLTPNGKALLRQHHGTLRATLALTPTGGTPNSAPLTLKRSGEQASRGPRRGGAVGRARRLGAGLRARPNS
jgi:hypothetical protein